jgi:hypothetical protein
MMDKWVDWATDGNTIEIDEEGLDQGFSMAENLNWSGAPNDWSGTIGGTGGTYAENTNLHATIRDWASGDLGVVASMADTLIYYAVANNVDSSCLDSITEANVSTKTTGERALWYAVKLLDNMWNNCRDDIGLTVESSASADFVTRFFTQEVYVPTEFGSMTLPNGGVAENGTTFLELRPKYKQDEHYATLEKDWATVQGLSEAEKADWTDAETTFSYHRFWHMGDILMALGAMAEYYPEVLPEGAGDPPKTDPTDTTPTTPTETSTTPSTSTTAPPTTPTGTLPTEPAPGEVTWGDVDVNGTVDVNDLVLLCKGVGNASGAQNYSGISAQGLKNADVYYDGTVELNDLVVMVNYFVDKVKELPVSPGQN